MRRGRRRSGRLLYEVLISMMIIGLMLSGVSDVYRQGERVRRRVDLDDLVRREVASTLAVSRASLRSGGKVDPGPADLSKVDPSLEGQIAVEAEAAGERLTRLVVTAKWSSGEHSGTHRREVLVRRDR